MRVIVDSEKCQGHNRCYALAPELFDVDDYGQAVVVGDGSVAPDQVDAARLAVANCPEFAISISVSERAASRASASESDGDGSRGRSPREGTESS